MAPPVAGSSGPTPLVKRVKPTEAKPPKPRATRQDRISLGVALVAVPIPFVLLSFSFYFMNRSAPLMPHALAAYIGAILVGGLGVAVPLLQTPERLRFRARIAASIGIPGGLLLALTITESYGFLGELGWFFFIIPIAGNLWLIGALAGVITWFVASPRAGADWASAICGGATLAAAVAALIHFLTFPQQVNAAQRANETPGLEIIALILILVGCVLWFRRAEA